MEKKKEPQRHNPTSLPDHLYFKKIGTRKSKRKDHQDTFQKGLQEDDINPDGKEDFDEVLRKALELPPDTLD